MGIVRILSGALVVLAFLTGIYFYPQMPERMASHWDINGQVDGYLGRDPGVFMLPILALTIFVLFLVLPNFDPLKKNYKAFMGEYDGMIALIVAFLYYVYLLTLAYNLGHAFDLTQLLSPAFGVLFFYLGIVMEKVKQNWFVGIRTPWTLSSQKVWDNTHRITGKMFKAAGVIALLGLVFPSIGPLASVAVILASAIFAVVYSYMEFKAERKKI